MHGYVTAIHHPCKGQGYSKACLKQPRSHAHSAISKGKQDSHSFCGGHDELKTKLNVLCAELDKSNEKAHESTEGPCKLSITPGTHRFHQVPQCALDTVILIYRHIAEGTSRQIIIVI